MIVIYVQVGFTNDGKITALEVNLYSNGGYSLDLTWPVRIHDTQELYL